MLRQIDPVDLDINSESFDLMLELRQQYHFKDYFPESTPYKVFFNDIEYLCQFSFSVCFIDINVENISRTQTLYLKKLLEKYQDSKFFNDIPYYVGDLFPRYAANYVVLSKPILLSKPYYQLNQFTHNYQFLNVIDVKPDQPAGAFGVVYDVSKRFKFFKLRSELSLKEIQKPFVVKLMHEHVSWSLVKNEAYFAHLAGHLCPDSPVKSDGDYYLVMAKMSGLTLEAILEQLRSGDLTLSLNQYFLIVDGLLNALCVQLHKHKIVHYDIKENNIIVDIQRDIVTVNIIDYGNACFFSSNLSGVNESFHLPPELRARYHEYYHPSADIYSAGLLIAYLFGAPQKQYPVKQRWNAYENGVLLTGMFKAPVFKKLSHRQKSGIKKLVCAMTHLNPTKRPSIVEAYGLFAKARIQPSSKSRVKSVKAYKKLG